MIREVARVQGSRMLGEIGRRGDQGEAEGSAEGHGDHIGREVLADAYTRIEAGGHNVGHGVVRRNLHMHARMTREEAGDPGHQHEAAGGTWRIDAQGAAQCLAEGLGRSDRLRDFSQGWSDPREEGRASLGRRDAAGGPVQEAHAHPRLQAAQRVA